MHSMGVHTHSMVVMCTQWVFRGCSHSLIGIHVHSMGVQGYSHSLIGIHPQSMGVQGEFSTHSLAFTCTQWVFRECSRGVQYSLKGIHMHSQAVRVCLILTQMRSFSLSHHGELHSIMTQWHSCALNGCSHSLSGIHLHSMVFRGCFHSLIGIHAHS